MFDRDHNGKISKEEIQIILRGKMDAQLEKELKEIMD